MVHGSDLAGKDGTCWRDKDGTKHEAHPPRVKKRKEFRLDDDDDELMLNVLRCHLTY